MKFQKRKVRRKRVRGARTVASVAAEKTTKKRLASRLNIAKRQPRGQLTPNVRSNHPVQERVALEQARHSAGVAQLSLFGSGLGLNYSPPG